MQAFLERAVKVARGIADEYQAYYTALSIGRKQIRFESRARKLHPLVEEIIVDWATGAYVEPIYFANRFVSLIMGAGLSARREIERMQEGLQIWESQLVLED